jgi:hypothetical protein
MQFVKYHEKQRTRLYIYITGNVKGGCYMGMVPEQSAHQCRYPYHGMLGVVKVLLAPMMYP